MIFLWIHITFQNILSSYLRYHYELHLCWRMASSGKLRRMALVRTDVSEELSASFIRVTSIGELGTTLAVTSNRRTLRTAVYIHLCYYSAFPHILSPCFPFIIIDFMLRRMNARLQSLLLSCNYILKFTISEKQFPLYSIKYRIEKYADQNL
jgi:hypothetical protein